MSNKVLLMILDGWGIAPDKAVSAIDLAQTPFIDSCYTNFPHATLNTTGLAVGLPAGQMGNSEVGHMNIGAGRVVYQNLARLNKDIEENTFPHKEQLVKAFEFAKKEGKKVHFIGLLSDGGVHSHITHLKALMDASHSFGLEKTYVHAFTDGRDCDPKSGKGFLEEIIQHGTQTNVQLASVIGRYFAMDRDKRWERVKMAYDVMVHGTGTLTENVSENIQNSYNKEVTDEFIQPLVLSENQKPVATIEEGDVVICFNFRTDRGREITEALTQKDFPEQGMKALNLYYVTMTEYDESYKNVKVVYEEDSLINTLGEVLANHQKKQIRIAETEKYPHVTFFFNGGNEAEYEGETRILCPSPKEVATYDLKPEMAAYDITDKIIPELEKQEVDFVCLNFANPDMVGHTGVMEAAIKACEVVDSCAEKITQVALEKGYTIIIIADHGNSDCLKNPDGSPNTQHTTNPVPLIVADKNHTWNVQDGKLGDLAPSILGILGVEIPKEMTGDIIIS